MIVDLRPILRRILLAGVPLLSAGCPCPEDPIRDQLYLLDDGTDGGLIGDGGPIAGDSGVGGAAWGNCVSVADGCASPDNCLAVCQCVLDRNNVNYIGIQQCKLDTQPGPRSVHVRYKEPSYCPGGRRPAGYADRAAGTATPVAAYLTRMAELEAASIAAFDILAAELEAHGAPRELVRRARGFRRDEARHWALMRAAARAHGGAAQKPRIPRGRPVRPLEVVLRDNMIEGCVRETYGAVLAQVQAVSAQDPALRAAFALIADDEANHAQLAWDVDAWGRRQLPAAARRRIGRARAAAAAELADGVAAPAEDAGVRRVLGLPAPAEQAALVARARTLLWS